MFILFDFKFILLTPIVLYAWSKLITNGHSSDSYTVFDFLTPLSPVVSV